MIVRTFSGTSLRDALRQVRETFGADAVILDTQFAPGGKNRLGAAVTVTAAHESDSSVDSPSEGPHTLHLLGDIAASDMPDTEEPESALLENEPAEDATNPESTNPESQPDPEPVPQSTVAGRRQSRGRQGDSVIIVSEEPVWSDFRRWLGGQPQLTTSLIESFATNLVESIPTPNAFLESRPKGQVVLFVGGHGVGKSTALFKALASRWQIRQRKPQVAILTAAPDTRPDWLKTVCAEVDLNCTRQAIGGKKLPIARPKRGDDLFVEYTTARNPEQRESQIKSIRRGLKPETVVLVLHSGASPSTWHAEYRRYATLPPTHVLFTHCDEGTPWWEIASFLRNHPIVASYRTAGHDPIGDILPLTTTDLQTGLTEHLARVLDWPLQTGRDTGVHGFATSNQRLIREPANIADNKG